MSDRGDKIVVRAGSTTAGQVVTGVLIAAGVTAAYFLVVKPVLEFAGLKKTKSDRQFMRNKALDPDYYKKHINRVTISTGTANRLANDIKMSYGWARPEEGVSTEGLGKGTLIGGILYGPLGALFGGVAGGTMPNAGNDDEERLISAVREAGSDYNLSRVADVFQKKYNQNMRDYIFNFANNADTEAMMDIIKSW